MPDEPLNLLADIKSRGGDVSIDLLVDIKSRGGDLSNLIALAHAEDKALQASLKELGYGKIGERARAVAALKSAPLDVSDATAPSAAAPSTDEPEPEEIEGDSTMVMHGAVLDIFDDGGLLKTTLRAGDASSGMPPPLSRCKVRYIGSILPACTRFEATVKEFQMGGASAALDPPPSGSAHPCAALLARPTRGRWIKTALRRGDGRARPREVRGDNAQG